MAISAQSVSIPRADISISRDKASALSWMNWPGLVMGERLHDGQVDGRNHPEQPGAPLLSGDSEGSVAYEDIELLVRWARMLQLPQAHLIQAPLWWAVLLQDRAWTNANPIGRCQLCGSVRELSWRQRLGHLDAELTARGPVLPDKAHHIWPRRKRRHLGLGQGCKVTRVRAAS
jgi:hypothetical protein